MIKILYYSVMLIEDKSGVRMQVKRLGSRKTSDLAAGSLLQVASLGIVWIQNNAYGSFS